ncbi:MAG: 16S rRNA (cytosine(1402)-N(4))-methyltransferase RsmH, partial [Deltaproteobacteria bacterium]|nr:16S rRNA (cytosine(1402)-N(4))-methyltransferase RsmH [Deltaproteobacteria bacterium]
LERTRPRLSSFGSRVEFIHGPFHALPEYAAKLGWNEVDGILADLGVSSFQLDEPERGFSFRMGGPLDMRMDPSIGMSAADWVNSTSEEAMADVFWQYGEERHSRRIARHLCWRREEKRFETTDDLSEEVRKAVPGGFRHMRIHPATRVFQAIRIEVNQELVELQTLLSVGPRLLSIGGRMIVLSYHSLEDRLVKRAFRALDGNGFHLPTKKVVVSSDEEIEANPRSRSAKLRVIERVS